MRKKIFIQVIVVITGMLILGCSSNFFDVDKEANRAPEIWLSSGPVERDTTGYQVHFYWGGWDPDGEIKHFEITVVSHDSLGGWDPADTVGTWNRTAAHDSIIKVAADGNPRPYESGGYTIFDKTHTFFIRGVDMDGKKSEAAYRTFTAWTLAPYANIEKPPRSGSGMQAVSTVITFEWSGEDPIDSPTNKQDPESTRWLFLCALDSNGIYINHVNRLNQKPDDYEDIWSPWDPYKPQADSGVAVTIGKKGELKEENIGKTHIFAVQAKDEAGAITRVFSRTRNVMECIPSRQSGPLLTITEAYLGGFVFQGRNLRPEKRILPPGIPLKFTWKASSADYGASIVGFRYGWDIQDVNDPSQWDVPFGINNKACNKTLYSGNHTLYIEVVDNSEQTTLARIEIEIIEYTMERNLLWVDDFDSDPSDVLPSIDYSVAPEDWHDEFWLDICSRAEGFVPVRDVYDVARGHNYEPPEINRIARYKNIIWTYMGEKSDNQGAPAWGKIIEFTPESQLGQGGQVSVNYLSLFLTKGGHIWTLGRSDGVRRGLAAMFGLKITPEFPVSLKYDFTTGEDTSSVNCMGYKDYCVSLVDKMLKGSGTYVHHMMYGILDTGDDVTMEYADALPETLALWSEATADGMFFDPDLQPPPYPRDQTAGLTYVEAYDVEESMRERGIDVSQSCFHPMYLQKTYNSRSEFNESPVALWLTKYDHVVPTSMGVPVGIAAKSFHFGFPLWWFDRDDVDAIVEVIFDEWQILDNTEE